MYIASQDNIETKALYKSATNMCHSIVKSSDFRDEHRRFFCYMFQPHSLTTCTCNSREMKEEEPFKITDVVTSRRAKPTPL